MPMPNISSAAPGNPRGSSWGTTPVPQPSAAGANGLAPMTGWAAKQKYVPEALNDLIWDNPWAILQDVDPRFEGKTWAPGYQALRDIGADPLALFNMGPGASGLLEGGAGEYANFLQGLYSNLGKRGGQAVSAKELMGNIFGQSGSKPGNNALWNIMAAGDASEQVRILFNLLREVSNVGMNPLAARGYQAAVARSGDTYMNEALTNENPQMMHEWLAKKYPSLAGR